MKDKELKEFFMNWRKILVILLGIILIAGGVFCLFTPLQTYLSTGYVVGVLVLCDAIASIFAWFDAKQYVNISGWYLFGAILSAIFGIAVIMNVNMQFAVDMAIIYLVCAWIIALAVVRTVLAVRIKQVNDALPENYKNLRWLGLILFSILMIAFAIICMIQPGIMSVILGTLISCAIITNGVSLITLASYMPTVYRA